MSATGARPGVGGGDQAYAVVCDRLIDGTDRDPVSDAVVLVQNGRIAAAGARSELGVPADAAILDWSGLTAMPGLIDSHEHLGIDLGDEEGQLEQPTEYTMARCIATARLVLRAGITTIRDCGERGMVGPLMKRVIEDGIVPGPRVLAAGRNICRTGGHGWRMGLEADGPDALRAAVRRVCRDGADVIKIMASGGISTAGSTVMAPEFTDEEFAAVIDEAHRRGRRVAAHGHGGPGVGAATRAGVDSIEHGLFLTDEDVATMVDHGTFLVVTAGSFFVIRDDPGVPQFQKDKVGNAITSHLAMLGRARGEGLRIAVGTDENHGKLWFEMGTLCDVGYSPQEAIRAATADGAELLGIGESVGTLETGKVADLIGVEGDPLTDILAVRDVRAVIKGGSLQFSDGG
jgi:imidazolonepropionase-like amidohydrolase